MTEDIQLLHFGYSCLADSSQLDHRLPQVLAIQHADEALIGLIDGPSMCLGRHLLVLQPFPDILLVLLRPVGTHVLVANEEASHGQSLTDEHHEILDAVLLTLLLVVLAHLLALVLYPSRLGREVLPCHKQRSAP
jgi:hypothetical protein